MKHVRVLPLLAVLIRPPGQLLLTTGKLIWEFDSAGDFVSFTQQGGTAQDVCALLS